MVLRSMVPIVPRLAARMATLGLLLLAMAFGLVGAARAQGTVTWRDAPTNAAISSWRTGQQVRVTLTNASAGFTFVVRKGTGAASDRGVLVGNLPAGGSLTFVPDTIPYRWYSYVWCSVIAVDRYGREYPVSTLWRRIE